MSAAKDEIGISTSRPMEVGRFRIDLGEVEAALLEHPSVDDCAVLQREKQGGGEGLVAYVVPSGPFDPERLHAHLQSVLPEDMTPSFYVPVSSLPLTATGEVDEQVLTRLEVIDSDLLREWEERLRSIPGIERVAVVVQEEADPLSPLHLSDLLPGWKAASTPEVAEPVAVSTRPAAAGEESEPKAPAISHGGPLRQEPGTPTTLPASLQRAAVQSPEKGVVYVQSDGSEIVQSYPDLLKEAERVLAGLRRLGLKPQDKVIFQFEHNEDFVTAFWGCALGGFVPVPISIAPTYKEMNATVTKLHNAWKMLDRPVVLTGKTLAPAVRSLSDLLKLEDFRVATIEDLQQCDPDRKWHDSQPDDLALLLLTSGSTGLPKAVMQSHRSLLSQSAGTTELNEFSNQDVTLNWMPLDHVGGIVFFHIRDVCLGCQQIHAPNEVILLDPLKWLDMIERFRATLTWAPNFAFGLVNDQAEAIRRRHWDLSSMRFILNGGEAIVAKTARGFLRLLQPHGLPEICMHPVWGMSETSSGVTYSDDFSLDSTKDEGPFVEVGAPIPGFSMRIVDAQDHVVGEGTIGRLQVRGSTVTTGYYKNPELNREVFTDDGWFNTGDLGFLRKGRLTITGREKDIMIVNGINYYSHEIEAVVEGIKGVDVSFTVACAVRGAGDDTDQLAIFFSPAASDESRLLDLIHEIREAVIRNAGVSPRYLIPVPRESIPKTSIGKIQGSQLSQRFEAGEFDAILKRLDILSGNANTLPDWFYQKVWHRKEAVALATQLPEGPFLVLLDGLGLGAFLCGRLGQLGRPCVGVEMGPDFAKLGPDRYRINPKDPDHYRRMVASLAEDGIQIAQVLHLWTYDTYAGEISSPEALERSQDQGIYSLLFLVQALAQQGQGNTHPARMLVISSHTQPVLVDDEIAYERSPVLGLIKTAPQEMPWLSCRHVDVPLDEVEVNAARILRELRAVRGDREIAYRNGQRWVPRLGKVDFCKTEKRELPFKARGMYLLSGGLGGIGVEIAKYLLQHYGARLLLVGRTPLPEKAAWDGQLGVVSERIKGYQVLEQLGGEVLYEAVDICDLAQLQKVVERAKARWQCELDGVIHLAGIYQEHLLVEETRDSFSATLRPKLLGTLGLHQLIEDRPNGVFISFSSLIGFFGGALVGAYCAANSFLDCFSHYQRHKCSLQSYCFDWSTWEGLGISRNFQGKDALCARGYQPMTPEQALNSFLIGLHHDQGQLLVGLDRSNRYIQRYGESGPYPVQKLSAYFTIQADQAPIATLGELGVRDRFGTQSTCDFQQIAGMPLTDTGQIDRENLVAAGRSVGWPVTERVAPRTDLERQIAGFWQEVLAVPRVGIHESFFELGGNSLLATQIVSRLREAFSVEVDLRHLFEFPTIAQLAEVVVGLLIEKLEGLPEAEAQRLAESLLPRGQESQKRDQFKIGNLR